MLVVHIKGGATIMWEEWGEDSRSHNHVFLGTVADWLYESLVGIKPVEPGYSTVEIKPELTAYVDEAQSRTKTHHGVVVKRAQRL